MCSQILYFNMQRVSICVGCIFIEANPTLHRKKKQDLVPNYVSVLPDAFLVKQNSHSFM